MTLKGPLFVLVRENGTPWVFRDSAQQRVTMPLFTSRLAAQGWLQSQPGLLLSKYATIRELCQKLEPFAAHAASKVPWIAIDHPGPSTPMAALRHLDFTDFFTLGRHALEMELEL